MLIVFFPAYVVTNIFLNKEYRVMPEKKNLRVRKWLLYFTLFVTALIILGDIVALVLNFMQGELTLRFIFKVFTILFVAGSIFGYYLWELKNSEYGRGIKTFIYIISAIIFISVVAGFTVAGSPAKERARKFDEQRVSNLSSIQWQIVEYWRSKESLPNELSDLNDPLRGFYVPRDPDTGKKYEYIKKGEMSFELCATFSRPSEGFYPEKPRPVKDAYMGGLDEYWEHGEGRTCFERTIDRDFYPPVSSQR